VQLVKADNPQTLEVHPENSDHKCFALTFWKHICARDHRRLSGGSLWLDGLQRICVSGIICLRGLTLTNRQADTFYSTNSSAAVFLGRST